MANITKYVTLGAMVQCDGAVVPAPLPLLVLPKVPLSTINGQLKATETDVLPIVNIPCFGLCKFIPAPPAPGGPCVPAPTGWQGAGPRTLSGTKVLNKQCTVKCALGGTIRFV